MIRAVIVDDERIGRETLHRLLRECCPGVDVVAEADSVETGRAMIARHHPNVVFLDIEMPYGNGFELLEESGDAHFDVIFTTAYDQYALRAIKSSAVDYLLKPIDRDELIAAVRKAERAHDGGGRLSESLDALLANLRNAASERHKVALPTEDGLILVAVADIIRCEAEGNYTRFHLTTHEETLVCRTLKEFETYLETMNFIRVHHSHLVNMAHVRKYLRGEGGSIVMIDGIVVPVSRRRKEDVLRALAAH